MKKYFRSLMFSLTLLGSETALLAEGTADRTVEQYKCRDFMRESGSNRDVAIAFLHGYLLGKSGNSKFNLDTLKKQSNEFVEKCLSDPDAEGMTVLQQIKK